MWFVYIVRCSDGTLYTGVTTDPPRRLAQHNSGKGAKYTRSRRPVEMVYVRLIGHKGAALKEEHRIKRLGRADKERLAGVVTP